MSKAKFRKFIFTSSGPFKKLRGELTKNLIKKAVVLWMIYRRSPSPNTTSIDGVTKLNDK